MKRGIAIVAVLAFAAGAAVAVFSPRFFPSIHPHATHAAAPRDEKNAPPAAAPSAEKLLLDSRVADLQGEVSALRERLRGKTLINFWASWCAPCLREMPLLDESAAQIGANVIGIAIDDERAVKAFLAQNPVNYDIFIVKNYIFKFFTEAGNENGVLPFSTLLGEDGEIYANKIGEFHSVADVEEFWRGDGKKI